jgi:hypothetical protein
MEDDGEKFGDLIEICNAKVFDETDGKKEGFEIVKFVLIGRVP